MKNEQGFTVWFTGLPSCGKTTIANQIAEILKRKDYKVEQLDGDIIRTHLSKDLGFSKEDREENIKRAISLAKKLTHHNIIVLASFVSPYRKQRKEARKEIKKFIEVYVRCPIEICIKRDVKGLYKKALEGEIKNFTGLDDPYEEPEHPELILDTNKETVEESVKKVLIKLEELGHLKI
jgi:adenylylsulfate kinase